MARAQRVQVRRIDRGPGRSYLGPAAKLALAAILTFPLLFSDVSAQGRGDVPRALGNLFQEIIRQAQVNQQRIDNARRSWDQVEHDVQTCLIQRYHLSPRKLANHGIPADDARIGPLIQYCQRQIAQQRTDEQARQEAQRQKELAQQQSDEQARQEAQRQQELAQQQADEQARQEAQRQQELAQQRADEQARQEAQRQKELTQQQSDAQARQETQRQQELAQQQADEQARQEAQRQKELSQQNAESRVQPRERSIRGEAGQSVSNAAVLVSAAIIAALLLLGAIVLLRHIGERPGNTRMRSLEQNGGTPDMTDKPRNLGVTFAVPFVGSLVTSAYATFAPASSPVDALVAVAILVVLLSWSVWDLVQSFGKGRTIAEGTQIRPIALFLVSLFLLALIIAANIAAGSDETLGGIGNIRSLQLILTFAFGGVVLILSIQMGAVDKKLSPDEPQLISRSVIYFLVAFLNFLILGSPWLFGFLSTSVPNELFRLAFEFRLFLIIAGAVVLVIDAFRLFSASYDKIRDAVAKGRLPLIEGKSGQTTIAEVIAAIFSTIANAVLLVLNFAISVVVWTFLLVVNFISSLFRATWQAIFSWALFFALVHTVGFAVLAGALLRAPWAISQIRQYLNGDESLLAYLVIIVVAFVAVSVVLAIIAFVSERLAWPKPSSIAVAPIIAFTAIGIWLSSALNHIAKSVFDIGPPGFGFSHVGYTFIAGTLFFAAAALVSIVRNLRTAKGS